MKKNKIIMKLKEHEAEILFHYLSGVELHLRKKLQMTTKLYAGPSKYFDDINSEHQVISGVMSELKSYITNPQAQESSGNA